MPLRSPTDSWHQTSLSEFSEFRLNFSTGIRFNCGCCSSARFGVFPGKVACVDAAPVTGVSVEGCSGLF